MVQKITVIIPAFNEEELLPRCLAALVPQAAAHNATVLVVDNNSTDRTAEIAKAAGVCVIHEPKQGVVFALQRGFQEATTELVAFSDADTIIGPHWLATIEKTLVTPGTVAVTGPVRFERMRFLSSIRWFYRHQLLGSNMALRRADGVAVGGFNINYNLASDIAFGWALKERGRVAYAKDMSVTTSSRRFQAQPFQQASRFVLNHIWMLLFHEPLFWHFSNIRRSAIELNRQATVRFWLWTIAFVLIVIGYLSWWPSSSALGTITVRGNTKNHEIALTFDDGPNGEATRTIVDTLTQKHVPATFFVIGQNVKADPATTKYIADHGFVIGNHSWDTSYDLAYDTPNAIASFITQTSDAITSATGQTVTYFRPPHGIRSPQLVYEAKKQSLRIVDWTVDGHDAISISSSTIINRVVSHARSGSILMLRDGTPGATTTADVKSRQATIQALPTIIDQLRQRGYTFVPLSVLLQKTAPIDKDVTLSLLRRWFWSRIMSKR